MNDELVRIDGFAQTRFDLKTGDNLLAQAFVEELKSCLSVALGEIHGGVGVMEEFLRCVAGGTQCDPYAGGHKHLAAFEVKRLRKPLENSRSDRGGVGL